MISCKKYVEYIERVRNNIKKFYVKKPKITDVVNLLRSCSYGTNEFDKWISKFIKSLFYGKKVEHDTNVKRIRLWFRLDEPLGKSRFNFYIDDDWILSGFHENCINNMLSVILEYIKDLQKVEVSREKIYAKREDIFERKIVEEEYYKYYITLYPEKSRIYSFEIEIYDFGSEQDSYYTSFEMLLNVHQEIEYKLTYSDVLNFIKLIVGCVLFPESDVYINDNMIEFAMYPNYLRIHFPKINMKELIGEVKKIENWYSYVLIDEKYGMIRIPD